MAPTNFEALPMLAAEEQEKQRPEREIKIEGQRQKNETKLR